jgi:cytochrome c2
MKTKRTLVIATIMSFGFSGAILATNQNDSIKQNIDSLKTGKNLYEASCVRCHKLKDPAKYTAKQWPGLVDKMQKRAKITDEQKAIILSYLVSEAKK